MCCINTMELCSAVRKNEILPFVATWMGLEILILSETRGRQIPYIITYFGTVVPEKALESPLVSMDVKSVNPKGNQLWIFPGRTDTAAEAPIFWQLDAEGRLIGKDPDAGKDWSQEKRGQQEEDLLSHQKGVRRLGGAINSIDTSLRKLQEMVNDWEACMLQSMGWQRVGNNLATEQQQQYVESKVWHKWIFLQNKKRQNRLVSDKDEGVGRDGLGV